MRWSDRIGRIAPGLQADMILLDQNPLETTANLRSVRSVVLRGQWIDDAGALMRKPETVWLGSETPTEKPSLFEVESLLAKRQALQAQGFVFNHFQIMSLSRLIEGFGYAELAAKAQSSERE